MGTSQLQRPKHRSLVAFLIMCGSIAAAIGLSQVPAVASSLLPGVLAAGGIIGAFWIAVRIKCPHCGVTLSSTFPYMGGGTVLLWAVNERCRKCHQPLN